MSENDIAIDRVILRASADYLLRISGELATLFGGDLTLGMVFLSVLQASIGHIPYGRSSEFFDDDGVVPTNLRRSVSTLAIANSLNMPRETVRRHINKLVEAGFLERDPRRRIMVVDTALRRPDVTKAVRANRAHLENFLRLLRRNQLMNLD